MPNTVIETTSLLRQENEKLKARVKELEGKLNTAYSERNYAAILAAKALEGEGCVSGWYVDPGHIDWAEDWKIVVMLGTPQGQVSWHMSPHEADLAKAHLTQIPPNWDGTFLSGLLLKKLAYSSS